MRLCCAKSFFCFADADRQDFTLLFRLIRSFSGALFGNFCLIHLRRSSSLHVAFRGASNSQQTSLPRIPIKFQPNVKTPHAPLRRDFCLLRCMRKRYASLLRKEFLPLHGCRQAGFHSAFSPYPLLFRRVIRKFLSDPFSTTAFSFFFSLLFYIKKPGGRFFFHPVCSRCYARLRRPT